MPQLLKLFIFSLVSTLLAATAASASEAQMVLPDVGSVEFMGYTRPRSCCWPGSVCARSAWPLAW